MPMVRRRPILLALIAVTLLLGLGWLLSGGVEAPTPELESPERVLEAALDKGAVELHDLAQSGRVNEGSIDIIAEAQEPEAAEVEEETVLSGRVVSDVLGAPLPGATVVISRRMISEFHVPDIQERNARQPVVTVVTDGEGRFEAVVPTAVPLDLEASASEHATARRDHLFAGDDVELRLMAAAVLEGVLRLASDGSAVEGALVLGKDSRRVEQCRALTDIDGRFLFKDLQPGLLIVQITPRDAAAPPSKTIELREGERTWLELTLEPGVRIYGTVSDSYGGPIAGAEIGLGASFKRSVFTDAHGMYEMFGLGGAKRRDLGDPRVRAEGYGNERKRLFDAELTQDTQLDFVLLPARNATGRVIDADGAPLEGVYVAGVGSKKVEEVFRSDWESTVTGDDGRFELASLHLLIDHQLFLRKEGYGSRVYDFPADEGDRDRVDYGDLVLHPGGRIEGVLLSQTGTPLPDHQVKLRGANKDLDRFRPDAEPLQGTWVTAVRHSRTDTQGRFHFTDLPGGELKVTASVRGRPEAKDEKVVELPEGGRVDGLELTLDLGDPITGVVLTPDGSPAVGIFVQVAGGKDQPRIRAVTGAGGRFELLGVTEDMGVVELFTIVASYNWSNPDARLGASRAVGARAGDTDLVLGLRELVSMTGRVEDAEGQPIEGVQVMAYLQGSPQMSAAVLAKDTSGVDGGFSLSLPEACLVDLMTSAPKAPESEEDDETAKESPPKPAVLNSVASDARGVVLRFAE